MQGSQLLFLLWDWKPKTITKKIYYCLKILNYILLDTKNVTAKKRHSTEIVNSMDQQNWTTEGQNDMTHTSKFCKGKTQHFWIPNTSILILKTKLFNMHIHTREPENLKIFQTKINQGRLYCSLNILTFYKSKPFLLLGWEVWQRRLKMSRTTLAWACGLKGLARTCRLHSHPSGGTRGRQPIQSI